MKVQLVVVQGKPEGMVIPLASACYKIGRGEGCQLRPNSDLVSREHAEFRQTADSVQVRDLGSRNGTEVNGKRLAANQPLTLKSGDLIKVGTLTFAISIEGAAVGKAAGPANGAPRKVSLDDVSNDEIDAWLVSDPSRPAPDRPSGVYGGDTITVETFKGQESARAKSVPTPRPTPTRPATPAPPVAAASATPPPVAPAPAPAPAPMAVPAPAPVAAPPPAPAPAAVAPVPPPPPAPVAEPAPAYFPSPEPIAPPVTEAVTLPLPPTPAPVAVAPPAAPVPPPAPGPTPPPAPAPAVRPTVEAPVYNPIFNFLADAPDLPDFEEEQQAEAEANAQGRQDDIPDFSSLDGGDEDDAGGAAADEPSPEEFIDESNPFFVKKPEATPTAAKAKPKDSSAAADDILRKIMDRRRAR